MANGRYSVTCTSVGPSWGSSGLVSEAGAWGLGALDRDDSWLSGCLLRKATSILRIIRPRTSQIIAMRAFTATACGATCNSSLQDHRRDADKFRLPREKSVALAEEEALAIWSPWAQFPFLASQFDPGAPIITRVILETRLRETRDGRFQRWIASLSLLCSSNFRPPSLAHDGSTNVHGPMHRQAHQTNTG